jgi:phosphoketolase
MGRLLRDVIRLNAEARNFRLVGPDETSSNRLDAVFEATDCCATIKVREGDNQDENGRRWRSVGRA